MITDDRQRETLSALIDREEVDADTLARVLDEPEGRALLVDFVRMRQTIARHFDAELDVEIGAGDPPQASRAVSRAAAASPRTVPRTPRRWRVLTAAALLAATAGGGFWLGERRDRQDGPPAPTRVIEFKPGIDWQSVPTR